MAKTDSFRDYLYVSVRKVVRMSQTLRTPGWQRVRGLDVKVGPVGGGVSLGDDPRAHDVIAMVPRVERAIVKHFGVKALCDPDLQVGQWVHVTGEQMSYGVTGPDDTVLFVGAVARLVLGGSAGYLLDRRATESRIGDYAPSSLIGLLRVIERLTLEDELREIETEPDASHLRDRNDGPWTRDYYRVALGDGLEVGAEPLTSLARVLLIDRSDDGATVVGTPLYVAFHVPR